MRLLPAKPASYIAKGLHRRGFTKETEVHYLVRKFPAGVEIIDRCGAAHGYRSTRLIVHSHEKSGGRTV